MKNCNQKQKIQYDLTYRELEVLALMKSGYSNFRIGQKLIITEDTVNTHIKSIFLKLKTTNRVQAIVKSIKECIL